MKTQILNYVLVLMTISFLGNAQAPEATLAGSYPALSFLHVNQLPNGEFITVSYGDVETDPNGMNTLMTTNGGSQWQIVSQTTTTGWPQGHLFCKGTHFTDDMNGIALLSQAHSGYGSPGIFKTTDGGTTWNRTKSFTIGSGIDGPNEMHFFDDLHGIVIVTNFGDFFNSYIWKTSDGGETWEALHDGSFGNLFFTSASIIDNGSIMISATEYDQFDAIGWKVIRFNDYGETFEEISSVASTETIIKEVQFLNDQVGFVGLHTEDVNVYDEVHKTTDGGATWTKLAEPSDVMSERVYIEGIHFINEMDGFTLHGEHCNNNGCFRGGALLHTTDGGQSWSPIIMKLYDDWDFFDMKFDDTTGKGYIVGGELDYTRGVIYSLNYEAGIVNSTEVDFDTDIATIYPNPSNGILTLSLNEGGLSDAQLQIFRIDGSLHSSHDISNLDSYKFELPLGFYTYHIVYNNKFDVGKILVVEE